MRKLMMMALCGLSMLPESAIAQAPKCGLPGIRQQIIAGRPDLAAKMRENSLKIQQNAEAYAEMVTGTRQKTTATVSIPVVFHVILTQAKIDQLGGTSGLQQRILSQMDVLNEDYNKKNADSTNIPPAFKPLYGNAEIYFGLAHRKPNGQATDGWEIKVTTQPTFSSNNNFGSDPKFDASGGLNAWDATQYLNIWIVDITEVSLLGYTIPPSFAAFNYLPGEFGVVIDYGAFGRRSSASQFFFPTTNDRGRTGTHEIGHYFELEHTFGYFDVCPGQTDDATGELEVDDDVADTPPQAKATFTSPGSCPPFPKTDVCSPSGNGIMWMNYMDYPDDKCLVMFTNGQVARMKSQLVSGQFSYSLTQHPELLQWPSDVSTVEKEHSLDIYPNPSAGAFRLSFSNTDGLQSIQVINLVGQQVKQIRVSNPRIVNYDIDLTGMSKGVYLVQCNFAAGNVTRKIVLQ